MIPPASDLIDSICDLPPGRALDLACGDGRHALWLRDNGWEVTAVDLAPVDVARVTCVRAHLERGDFTIEPAAWDLIVCWLYWQENLLPPIARGVRDGGVAALAGKTSGRFATSLERYRNAFQGWKEIHAREDEVRACFIARKPRQATRLSFASCG
jgi:SAM-dependent methyltransferase